MHNRAPEQGEAARRTVPKEEPRRAGLLFSLALAASILLGIVAVQAETERNPVRILTSFPPAFFEPFRQEFAKRNPDVEVEVIQRKTTAALSSMTGTRPVPADIFWASAPDAFELLKAAGRLMPLRPRPTGAPDLIAGYPVNDPDHHYLGFALSGYGLVYNGNYLSARGLPVPATWDDLTAPVYAGHIGVSSPSRSGTTHLVVEALLQSRGWERGWALWSAIGGNLATVTARSFGVSAGVARGRFGVGVSIDFLGRPEAVAGDPVAFVLPREVVFAPASIALLADAPNRPDAERFVDFVLSPEGQALLLRSDIGRLPVSPAVLRPQDTTARDLLTQNGDEGRSPFDAALSARRYEVVNILFDEMITQRRAALVQLWRRLQAAERALGPAPEPGRAAPVGQARALLERPPLTEAEAGDPDLVKAVMRVPRGLPVSEVQARLEATVRTALDANHEAAAALLARFEDDLVGDRLSGGRP